jgi:hypothetical protein
MCFSDLHNCVWFHVGRVLESHNSLSTAITTGSAARGRTQYVTYRMFDKCIDVSEVLLSEAFCDAWCDYYASQAASHTQHTLRLDLYNKVMQAASGSRTKSGKDKYWLHNWPGGEGLTTFNTSQNQSCGPADGQPVRPTAWLFLVLMTGHFSPHLTLPGLRLLWQERWHVRHHQVLSASVEYIHTHTPTSLWSTYII